MNGVLATSTHICEAISAMRSFQSTYPDRQKPRNRFKKKKEEEEDECVFVMMQMMSQL